MLRFLPPLVVIAAICLLSFFSVQRRHKALAEKNLLADSREACLPHRFLWVWERPEDLHELSTPGNGIAVLSGSLTLSNRAAFTPRRNPILMPANIAHIAVIRIETGPRFGEHHRDRALLREAVEQLVQAGNEPGVAALQIDFDARRSERAFYRDLLEGVRGSLPASLPLEMTALVSWCGEDNWIAELPVNSATPMFFRMEPGRARLLRSAGMSAALPEPLCDKSVGVSTHEPWPTGIQDRRVYVFADQGWKADLPLLTAMEPHP